MSFSGFGERQSAIDNGTNLTAPDRSQPFLVQEKAGKVFHRALDLLAGRRNKKFQVFRSSGSFGTP
jgi:hypothetical protein